MKKKNDELLLDLADENDGYVSVAESRENGIAQTYLSLAVEAGLFLKVSKGLYRRRHVEPDPFYELSFRYKKAVFDFHSALYLHGLSDDCVLEVALPLNYLTKGVPGVKSRHLGNKEFSLGQSYVVSPKGNLISSFDLERTMIDLLRNEAEFDRETFIFIWKKALEKAPYPEKLQAYAEAFHEDKTLRMMTKLF